MGFWAVAGPILGQLAGGIGGSAMGNQAAGSASKKSWERELWGYKHRYRMMLPDMKAAGINPILAASGGFSASGAPDAQMAQAFAPNFNNADFSSSAKGFAEANVAEAQAKKISMDTLKSIEETKEVIAKTANERKRNQIMTVEEERLTQEMFNLESEFDKKVREISKIDEEIKLLQMKAITEQSQKSLLDAKTSEAQEQVELLTVNAQSLKANLEKLKKISNVYSGPAGQIMSYISEIMHGLNVGAGVFLKGGK